MDLVVPRSEFTDWRALPITKDMLNDIELQVNSIVAELLSNKPVTPERQMFIKGMFDAFSQVASWMPKFEEEETDAA